MATEVAIIKQLWTKAEVSYYRITLRIQGVSMPDLNYTLAFEVKKELADRYFGFRKIIEEDTNAYQQNIITSALELENKIGFDLVRLYVLLRDNVLINDLFKITGLGKVLFYDQYITKSATIRKQVLKDIHVHGLTRKWRFQNMFFDLYDSLEKHVAEYRQNILDLAEDRETIKEEINLFYQKMISAASCFFSGVWTGKLLAVPALWQALLTLITLSPWKRKCASSLLNPLKKFCRSSHRSLRPRKLKRNSKNL